jgi:pseudaminic acid synthase
MKINGINIGINSEPYIIAEMSGNHMNSLKHACKLMEKCAQAGVSAFKIQSYSAKSLTIDCSREEYIVRSGPWNGRTLYDLYSQGQTPNDWLIPLSKLAKELGITLFSTPFGIEEVDILESIDVPAYKVASFEITYKQLLEKIGSTRKPVIFSTGLATIDEISKAVDILKNSGSESIAILKCTTSYPAIPSDLNLRTIQYLIEKFALPVGFSDHTKEITAAIVAVGAGATIFEKHVKLDEDNTSVDSTFSIPVSKLKQYVDGIREAYVSMGVIQDGPTQNEKEYLRYRRSIVASRDIGVGEMISEKDVAIVRPSHGLEPEHLSLIVGKSVKKKIDRGEGISFNNLD